MRYHPSDEDRKRFQTEVMRRHWISDGEKKSGIWRKYIHDFRSYPQSYNAQECLIFPEVEEAHPCTYPKMYPNVGMDIERERELWGFGTAREYDLRFYTRDGAHGTRNAITPMRTRELIQRQSENPRPRSVDFVDK
jgi:hypothetical protein